MSCQLEQDSVSDVELEETQPIAKRKYTIESVSSEFNECIQFIQTEIDQRRQNSVSKAKTGVKFLQSVNKKLRTLRTHSLRAMKQRKNTRKGTAVSGFNKPVQISPELAKFTGWDIDEQHSRSDTTRFLCEYIKKNNLQNPQDRRQIRIEKDLKLKKLLGYDCEKDDKPLTYPRLQIYLKQHYIKTKID